MRAAAKEAISRSARVVAKAAPKTVPKPVPRRDVPSHPEQTRRSSPLPTRFEEELLSALGSRDASRFREQLSMAESAFRRERYFDARRTLAPLMGELAAVASARELYGLTLYRLGKWRVAAAELEAYRTLSGSVEHLPVLADCYRALRRHAKVAELWTELKAASPSAAVVAEGRIVMAGSLADRGDLRSAIALLRPAGEMPRRLRDHHIRTWYVLADLYDRSGDATAARQLFGRIRDVAPGFADAEDRLAALGR